MTLIVVVEDDADIRDLIVMWLERAGYEVDTAPNGRAGLELCQQRTPDLVVMDVMMPVMSGHEAVVRMREDERLRVTPVVMLSAGGLSSDREAGLAAGADTYVTKPFELSTLTDAIAALLERRAP